MHRDIQLALLRLLHLLRGMLRGLRGRCVRRRRRRCSALLLRLLSLRRRRRCCRGYRCCLLSALLFACLGRGGGGCGCGRGGCGLHKHRFINIQWTKLTQESITPDKPTTDYKRRMRRNKANQHSTCFQESESAFASTKTGCLGVRSFCAISCRFFVVRRATTAASCFCFCDVCDDNTDGEQRAAQESRGRTQQTTKDRKEERRWR